VVVSEKEAVHALVDESPARRYASSPLISQEPWDIAIATATHGCVSLLLGLERTGWLATVTEIAMGR